MSQVLLRSHLLGGRLTGRALCHKWGLGVTICLAARTTNGPIVTVSDRRVSWGDSGVPATDDGTLKIAFLVAKQWGILFAADDMSPVAGIIDDIRRRLELTKEHQTEALVREAVQGVYRAAFEERFVASRVSRVMALVQWQTFRQAGVATFGPKLMMKFSNEIDAFNLGVALIVYGFDIGPPFGHQHIFVVDNPGIVSDRDAFGFGIIGSGSDPALSALLSKPFKPMPVVETVWRLCEAKFAAEAAFAVGKRDDHHRSS